MARKRLLIDLENIQDFELSEMGDQIDVVIFVGATQTISRRLLTDAKKIGGRVTWQRIEGSGPNALDFHIACHLGRILETDPTHECYVLSRDRGFDPLLKFLSKKGLKSRRIEDLFALGVGPSLSAETNYRRVVSQLRKAPKKLRPREHRTLAYAIAMLFGKKLAPAEIDEIITRLRADKILYERGERISYP